MMYFYEIKKVKKVKISKYEKRVKYILFVLMFWCFEIMRCYVKCIICKLFMYNNNQNSSTCFRRYPIFRKDSLRLPDICGTYSKCVFFVHVSSLFGILCLSPIVFVFVDMFENATMR